MTGVNELQASMQVYMHKLCPYADGATHLDLSGESVFDGCRQGVC